MKRLELAAVALFAACWLLVLLDLFGVIRLAGARDIGFYPIYFAAAGLGSVSGHVLVWRLRRLDGGARRQALLLHVAGPPGALVLLRAFAPEAAQTAAPLVPVLAVLVYAVFLIVPLLLRRGSIPPER